MKKKYTGSYARNLRLNVWTNGFCIKQTQCWRMTTVYFGTLQSRQIRNYQYCKIINITVPRDKNVKVKELEKITKYQDLRLQVQNLWNVKAAVVPVIVGALGTVCEELENHLKRIGIPIAIGCLQKITLLGTAFILRTIISESG